MSKANVLLNLVLLFGAIATTVSADIYRYVDDNGTVMYTDKPVGKDKPNPVKLQINSFSRPKVEPFSFDPSLVTKRAKSTEVIMYSTAWCGYCKQARRYFRAQSIPFTEYDIEKSARGKKDYQALNGRGVPIILAGDRRMNGFSVEAFKRIYRP